MVAVAADRGHHFSKPPQARIVLVEGHGASKAMPSAGAFVKHRLSSLAGSRASPALRQVHLIPAELFASSSDAGFQVAAGDLGENITTAGLDLGGDVRSGP